MRTAEGAKCASDPHVDCALRHGRKSSIGWHRSMGCSVGRFAPYRDRITFDRSAGRRKTRPCPPMAFSATV